MASPERRPRSIRTALMLIVAAVVLVTTAVFTVIQVRTRTRDLVARADTRLLMAAELSRELLGPDYHDRIHDAGSVSPESFRLIVARNDDLCRRLDLQYLWSVLRVGDRLLFTSATHSDLRDPGSPCASFFETHRDPQSFAPVLHPGAVTAFSSFRNEWGAGRMVLVPHRDALGRTYIFGASVQLTELSALIRHSLLTSLAIGLLVVCGALLLALLLSRSFAAPIVRLTEAASCMAAGDFDVALPSAGNREMESLSRSLDRMRQGLRQQLSELRASEMLLNVSQRLSKVGGWEWAVARQAMTWTAETYRIHDMAPGEFPAGSPQHIEKSSACYVAGARETILEAFRRCVEQGVPYDMELPFRSAAGRSLWVRTTAEAVRVGGQTVKVVGNIMDVTERRRAEEALRESELKYRGLFENAPVGIFRTNSRGQVLTVNSALARMLGCSSTLEALRRYTNLGEQLYASAERREQFLQALRTAGFVNGFEYEARTVDGQTIWLSMNARIECRLADGSFEIEGFTTDISERRRQEAERLKLETQLLQADKMATLGTLAAGVAHEINNPNNYLMLNADIIARAWNDIQPVLERHLRERGDLRLAGLPYSEVRERFPKLFSGILEGSRRIQEIVADLREYAVPDRSDMARVVEVERVLQAAVHLTRNMVQRSTTRFTQEFACGLPPVRGSAQKLEQLFINLIQNSCQALTDPAQEITLSCRLDEAGSVVVVVSDQGGGIAPEDLAHVADPFFTTHRETGGTGLGLPICKRIVEDHGGTMSFDSAVGRGTTVTVTLPAAR